MRTIRPPYEALDHDCWSQVASILFEPSARDGGSQQSSTFSAGPWTIEMHPSEDETDQHRYQITRKFYAWRQSWYWPVASAERLRERYAGRRERYFARFRLGDDEREVVLEQTMRRFVRLEKHMLGQMRWRGMERYWKRGRELVEALGEAIDVRAELEDFLIASIDFEGCVDDTGVINQFGVAVLDTRRLWIDDGADLDITSLVECKNFVRKLRRSGNQNFLFGTSAVIGQSRKRWRDVVLESLAGQSSDSRKVCLISHGLKGTELHTLEYLGIHIEKDLPGVVGLFDMELASPVETGRKAWKFRKSLGKTMEAFHIPFEHKWLHCAGNDAFYTLQVLLGMLAGRRDQVKEDSGRDLLQKLAIQTVATVPRMELKREGSIVKKHDAPCDTYFDTELFALCS